MKIVSWNCNGALRNKLHKLSSFEADVYIIQECENPNINREKNEEFRLFSANNLWVGRSNNKGLGVFAKNSAKLEKLKWDHSFHGRELQWFIPFSINNDLKIVAVWNHRANAKAFPYIGQFWLFMQNNKEKLRNSIICGDFNSNTIWDNWDRWWNHTDVVRELEALEIVSLYHCQTGEEQGKEKQPTFYMHRNSDKPYHIDYAFIARSMMNGSIIKIGSPSEWLELSDHMPLVVELRTN
jgi:exonuclease III